MNWDDFYNAVIEGQEGIWKIQKQPDGTVFLFDTTRPFTWMMGKQFEIDAYNSLKINPSGKILMAGLGIGYEAFLLKELPEVEEIVIVEREQEIINLTTAYLNHPKITVVHDHILHYLQTTDKKFDLIYFDIFEETPAEYVFPNETAMLKSASIPLLNPDGRIHFWNKWTPRDL